MKRIYDDLHVFCAVVEEGNLKKASAHLGVPHSTVSRRLDALEKNLQLTLFHRTTRDIRITQRGQALYDDCAPLLNSLKLSVDCAIDAEQAFQGHLKISMPVRAGIDFLGGWLIDFTTDHPDLKLDISLSNDNLDLLKEDIDLAFRVGPLTDSSAIAMRLWDIPYQLCASTAFVERHQLACGLLSQTQLEQLPCVVTLPARQWIFVDPTGREVQITPNSQLTVNDLGLACHAIKQGQALGLVPAVMMANESIVSLSLEDLQPRTRTMYAYHLGRRHAISQIRQLIDYIKQRDQQNATS